VSDKYPPSAILPGNDRSPREQNNVVPGVGTSNLSPIQESFWSNVADNVSHNPSYPLRSAETTNPTIPATNLHDAQPVAKQRFQVMRRLHSVSTPTRPTRIVMEASRVEELAAQRLQKVTTASGKERRPRDSIMMLPKKIVKELSQKFELQAKSSSKSKAKPSSSENNSVNTGISSNCNNNNGNSNSNYNSGTDSSKPGHKIFSKKSKS